MQFQEIQFWGDSILKGVVYDETRNRYVLLKENAVKLAQSQLGLPIVNRSQMGRTAPQALELMQQECAGSFDGKLVVLEYGGNDCDYRWAEVAENPDAPHMCRTPDSLFTDAMEGLVEQVRILGGTPVLCSMPPLDANRYFRFITKNGLSARNILKFIGDTEHIYRWQEYYSSLVLRMATHLGCVCMPIRETFLRTFNKTSDAICLDGIHPNATGHRVIADAATDTLSCLLV